ncbi:hypothetical protein Tco_0718905 [Tanacetum coccineum]
MVGVPRRIIQHSLNVNLSITPVAQKQRVLSSKKSKAVMKEVEEWIKAGIVRPVQYPTWISNPVLVKKVDDTWRMCIDFKNMNSACPKDYYPLPEFDLKIKVVMGFHFKYAVQPKERMGNLLKIGRFSFPSIIGKKFEGVCGRHGHQEQNGARNDDGHIRNLPQLKKGQYEVKSKEMLIQSKRREVPWLHGHIGRNPGQSQELRNKPTPQTH